MKQNNDFWNLPKEGLKSNLADDLFNTIAKNLEEEIGLKGVSVIETKSVFRQIAVVFDFDKQIYDNERSKAESKRDRPTKGKWYHLAIMEFRGSDLLSPLAGSKEINDLRWVSDEEGKRLMKTNKGLSSNQGATSDFSVKFNIKLFTKVLDFYLYPDFY